MNFKKNNIIKIISILFIVLFIFSVASVKAITINPNLPGAQVPSSNNNICSSIINFYWFAIFISGILAFGAIVYGGIRYELAAGNPGGQSEGKKWIMGALEGMLLLFSAYLILKIINPALTKCELPQLSTLQQGQVVLPGSNINIPLLPKVLPQQQQDASNATKNKTCSDAGGSWVLSGTNFGPNKIIITKVENGATMECIVLKN